MNSNNNSIKCPECGESNFTNIGDSTCKCNICGNTFFVTTPEINIQLNMALTHREMYEFSQSDQIYQNIIDKTDDEKIKVMCNFGRLLSYFGIVYVKGYYDGKYTITYSMYHPECNSIKDTSFYKNIVSSKYRYLYEDKLEQLDIEYKRIKDELSNTPLYDVFICVKISARTKNNLSLKKEYTEDSEYATQFYEELKNKGLKVFYSKKVLSGIDYDAQIYSALMRSKNILVITTDKDYLESAWVQSEWRRWINFINTGVKEKNSLFLFIPSEKHFELPNLLAMTQKFNKELELVNIITERVLPKKEKISTIDELRRKANTYIVLKRYEEAKEILDDLCINYPDDYRPWTDLMDLLNESKVQYGDDDYIRYYNKALSICTDKNQKELIKSKYLQFLSTKGQIDAKKENVTISNNKQKQNNNTVIINGSIANNHNSMIGVSGNNNKQKQNNNTVIINGSIANNHNSMIGVSGNNNVFVSNNSTQIRDVDTVIKTLDLGTKKKKCPVCYADLDEDETICPCCDTVQESNISNIKLPPKKTKYCLGCGMEIDETSLKCPNCGYIEHYYENIGMSKEELTNYAFELFLNKDYKNALKIFTKLANEEVSQAQYQLGYMYLYGEGVEKNLESAIFWLNKAILNGEKLAYYVLASLYHKEKSTLSDLYEARKLYQSALSNGIDCSEQIDDVNKMIYNLENQTSTHNKNIDRHITSTKQNNKINILMLVVFSVLQFLLLLLFDRTGIHGHLMIAEPTYLVLFAFVYKYIGYYKPKIYTLLENLLTVLILLLYTIVMFENEIVLIVFLLIVTCIFMVIKEVKFATSIQFVSTMVVVLIALFLSTHLLPFLYFEGEWNLLWFIFVQNFFICLPGLIWKNKYDISSKAALVLHLILMSVICITFIVLHIILICQLGLSIPLITCTILVSILTFILSNRLSYILYRN